MQEIKRFTLLDNGRIIENISIDSNDDFEFYNKHTKKTTDNILDLVEVGDMVTDGRQTFIINIIYTFEKIHVTRFYSKEFETPYEPLEHSLNKDEVVTFWKLQPNGDYKRYEVR